MAANAAKSSSRRFARFDAPFVSRGRQRRPRQLMPADMATLFTTNLSVSTTAWWLEKGSAYSPEQMATWFLDFLLYGYPGVLGLDAPSSEEKKSLAETSKLKSERTMKTT